MLRLVQGWGEEDKNLSGCCWRKPEGDQAADQQRQLRCTAAPAGKDVLVAERIRCQPCRRIGDEGEPRHFQPKITPHDRLGNRRHGDGVGTQHAQSADFGGGLVGRTGESRQDATMQTNSLPAGKLLEVREEILSVEGAKIDERMLSFAPQRVVAEKIEMIGDQHEVAREKLCVDASGSIGQQQLSATERMGDARRNGSLAGAETLVEMVPSLEKKEPPTLQGTGDETAGMAGNAGRGKSGKRGIGENPQGLGLLGESAKTRAEHDCKVERLRPGLTVDGLGHLAYFSGSAHARSASSFLTRSCSCSGLNDLLMKSSAPAACTSTASASLR